MEVTKRVRELCDKAAAARLAGEGTCNDPSMQKLGNDIVDLGYEEYRQAAITSTLENETVPAIENKMAILLSSGVAYGMFIILSQDAAKLEEYHRVTTEKKTVV